jgi:hypothetical protein
MQRVKFLIIFFSFFLISENVFSVARRYPYSGRSYRGRLSREDDDCVDCYRNRYNRRDPFYYGSGAPNPWFPLMGLTGAVVGGAFGLAQESMLLNAMTIMNGNMWNAYRGLEYYPGYFSGAYPGMAYWNPYFGFGGFHW